MPLLLAVILIIIAFYVMTKIIDEHFIKSLDNISEWLKLPESVSGATLLAFGTSAPEISTALFALFLASASPAIGVGAIVGSAIFQILVVIGFAAVVKTAYLNWQPVVRDSAVYAAAIILLVLFIRDGVFTTIEGAILVASYGGYLVLLYLWARYLEPPSEPDPLELVEKETLKKHHPGQPHGLRQLSAFVRVPVDRILNLIPDAQKYPKWTVPVFVLSLLIIAGASYLMVISATSLATTLGVPAAIIGLTILAGGTSIAELVSSAIVSRQGRGDMAIANAIGSNTFDILISLGLPVLIYTLIHGPVTDFGGANITSSLLLLFFTLLAVLLLLASQKFKITRKMGWVLIGIYVIYVIAAYSGWLGNGG